MAPLLALALLQTAPPIVGTVTYRERFAVPRDSTVELVLARKGTTIATLTTRTEGRQVPFEFAFARPKNEEELTLQARIRSAGRTYFETTAPVPVFKNRPTVVRLIRAREDSVLLGRRWTLVTMDGAEVTDRAPTIEFLRNGGVIGFAGINRFSGARTGEWPGLRIDPGVMTKMAGTEEANRAEAQFVRLLREVERAEVNGDLLTLWADGRATLTFRATPER